ncbi:MFS transporter [Staphylococcus hominis]|uniref:MFS transporter n=1 Tax=Staphylococcus hominis TaxID=1290 RepID=UPI00119CB74D|nr:MFS transporter [Staphylococcus hominis]
MTDHHNENINNGIKRKTTLEDIKDDWFLNYNRQIVKIASLIENEYKEYLSNPLSYQGKEIDFETFLTSCKGMQPQLIPYSYLTGIIFQNDMKLKFLEDSSVNESSFADIIEGNFEKYLLKKFNADSKIRSNDSSKLISQESLFDDDKMIQIDENLMDLNKKEIIVCYKIIEHIKLAISQKEGLYIKQKKEITKLTKSIESTRESYNNMVSNYISILGIFAAILMTAFGGIQAFTSIYRDNKFDLIDSLLIACIGFLGILLMMFLLLNSIAKLSGKRLDSGSSGDKWYLRHTIFVNSSIILSTVALILIAYKVSINPPTFSWWLLLYFIPLIYLVAMLIIFNRKGSKKNKN